MTLSDARNAVLAAQQDTDRKRLAFLQSLSDKAVADGNVEKARAAMNDAVEKFNAAEAAAATAGSDKTPLRTAYYEALKKQRVAEDAEWTLINAETT